MLGRTIRHYVIEEELGRGGMGVVYKARDTRLDRHVALKFLPPYLTQDHEARERFAREAKAAAGIDHPNICTIHEIAETEDGQTYIVMAYYGGETLNDRISRGPLPINDAVEIAAQMADGLASAHENGIAHRDVKPGNVVVGSKGEVKILDFGLAKLAGPADLTQVGSTAGTAAYMAPEQVRGEFADYRADIWSLGVVLYEMLTGQRPFGGAYAQAVSYAILNEEPKDIRAHRPEVSKSLTRIVSAAISKDADGRPSSAAEVASKLRDERPDQRRAGPARLHENASMKKIGVAAIGVGVVALIIALTVIFRADTKSDAKQAPEARPTSLAVLPFANLKSDPDTDYLGFALATQIINALDYLRSVSVRPSSSVRQYVNPQVGAVTAGRELGVNFVLTGNYLKENNQVRLTVELVDVLEDAVEWREPINVPYESTFQLQDIVSQKVIDGLRLQFSSEEIERSRTDVPHDPLAYELYLRGISQPSSMEGRSLAIQLLEQSIDLDSLYAPAWDALGLSVRRSEVFGAATGHPVKRADYFFDRALALNPQLLSALGNKVILDTDLGDLDDAFVSARRITEINPNGALGHFALGYVYRYAGLLDLSVKEMTTAIAIDPTNRLLRSAAPTYYYAGLWDEVLRAADIDRGSSYGLAWKTTALVQLGRHEEALDVARRIEQIDPGSFEADWAQQQIAVATNDRARGIAATRRIDDRTITDSEIWFWQATYYSAFGDVEKSLWALETAVGRGYYAWQAIERHPLLENAREDPRLTPILERARQASDEFRSRHLGDAP